MDEGGQLMRSWMAGFKYDVTATEDCFFLSRNRRKMVTVIREDLQEEEADVGC